MYRLSYPRRLNCYRPPLSVTKRGTTKAYNCAQRSHFNSWQNRAVFLNMDTAEIVLYVDVPHLYPPLHPYPLRVRFVAGSVMSRSRVCAPSPLVTPPPPLLRVLQLSAAMSLPTPRLLCRPILSSRLPSLTGLRRTTRPSVFDSDMQGLRWAGRFAPPPPPLPPPARPPPPPHTLACHGALTWEESPWPHACFRAFPLCVTGLCAAI